MTVLEAIQANPIFSELSEKHIQSVMSGRSIDGSATYTESSLKAVELATADLYYNMALFPDFKEGQLAIKYDAKALLEHAKRLYLKYNDAKATEFEPKPINVGISSVDV